MKNPKKLTRAQKITVNRAGITDVQNWSLIEETSSELCIINRTTGDIQNITKKKK